RGSSASRVCTAPGGGGEAGRGSATVRARRRGSRADGVAPSGGVAPSADGDPVGDAAVSGSGRLPVAVQSTGRTRRDGSTLPRSARGVGASGLVSRLPML